MDFKCQAMRSCLVLTILFFAGCGMSSAPAYKSIIYTLPATAGGRMCVDQCSKARDYCAQSCILDYRACTNDMQAAAQQHYDQYVRDRFTNTSMTELLPSDFEHPEACNAEKKHCLSDCDHPYDACYTSCGGKVDITSSCRFLCFE